MASLNQSFFAANVIFWIFGLLITLVLLALGARHFFLVGYAPQQRRLRVYMALLLILLIVISISAIVMNLISS